MLWVSSDGKALVASNKMLMQNIEIATFLVIFHGVHLQIALSEFNKQKRIRILIC